MKRLQSEIQSSSDKASSSSSVPAAEKISQLENIVREVELKASTNQIQMEIVKDYTFGELKENIYAIEDELVRIKTSSPPISIIGDRISSLTEFPTTSGTMSWNISV